MSAVHTPLLFTDEERFVWLGTHAGDNGAGVSMEWRVSLPPKFDDAARLLGVVGPYNDFDPRPVAKMLRAHWDQLLGVDIARERTMALYVKLPYTLPTGEFFKHTGEVAPLSENLETANLLVACMFAAGAAEVAYNLWHDTPCKWQHVTPDTVLAPSDHVREVSAWWR